MNIQVRVCVCMLRSHMFANFAHTSISKGGYLPTFKTSGVK